ncbi:TatD family deoxyribonuclease [Lachnospiraceae bacterium]|jgi:TatD DNase family protein|nr:TatD family deoxyribonuclease [Lachnospiraceae bacterium]
MIFDSHAHYDDEAFDGDREALFDNMHKEGVDFVVNVGASMDSSQKTLALARKYPFIYGAVGVHPTETADLTEGDMQWIKEKTAEPKVVAIGEIGLDYHWDEPDRLMQKKWFERQLGLAAETGLPVIIHSRDAAQDTLAILKSWQENITAGVIHCFSYTKEIAREYLDRNYYFGIGGVITFPNAKKLVEAVKYIPMNRILLETDCPYLAPEPYRGWRNQSSYISLVAERLAEIKEITKEEVLRQTLQNAKDFYRIP